MNKQQIRKIKEYAEKLLGLCDGETILPLKLIEDGNNAHFEACERNAYEVGETQDKLRREYRKKVLALLEDDWAPIVRILEDHKPQKIARLDEMRQIILCHTDPDKKFQNWIEPRDGKLSPNEYLSSAIEKLNETLRQIAKMARKERKWRIVKIIFYVTSSFVVFFAALLAILHYLGWLEPIKAFIYRMVGK